MSTPWRIEKRKETRRKREKKSKKKEDVQEEVRYNAPDIGISATSTGYSSDA